VTEEGYDAVLDGNTKYMMLEEPVRRIDQAVKEKLALLIHGMNQLFA
jgi:hypothetical protein